jgi:hypothetical protein
MITRTEEGGKLIEWGGEEDLRVICGVDAWRIPDPSTPCSHGLYSTSHIHLGNQLLCIHERHKHCPVGEKKKIWPSSSILSYHPPICHSNAVTTSFPFNITRICDACPARTHPICPPCHFQIAVGGKRERKR